MNLVEKAKYFAIANHGTQKYNGLPYFYHLESVVDVLKEFGFNDDKYLTAGYLHDVLEDSPVSYNDIKKEFGWEIAEMVYCVTDELGRNRKERKEKTYPKLRNNMKAILIKLADRIVNIRSSLESGFMLDVYIKEYPKFKEELFFRNEKLLFPMWDEIESLLKIKE